MRYILCILTIEDQSATFPTKIAWSLRAIDHVQSQADWHKNPAGARHILSVYLAESDIYPEQFQKPHKI